MARQRIAGIADSLTPLGRRLAETIRAAGPIGIDRFMQLALGDPDHGYYRTRDPLGRAGDFTTAPEISQVFGDIVGAWCAEAWRRIGAPGAFNLIELGPGRGTLAADLLRAFRVLPACRHAVRLHLVETSPVLRDRQAAMLAAAHGDIPVTWHEAIERVPAGPFLLVANEFLDALPIRQWVREGDLWRERLVGLNAAAELTFTTGEALDAVAAARVSAMAPAEGEGIFEESPAIVEIAWEIGRRLRSAPGMALIVDYGHVSSGFGKTLQAVARHEYVPPLERPGEADLTAHVDFAALSRALTGGGGAVWGPVSQRDFLIRNGALLRSEMLRRRSDDAATISRGVDRLIDPDAMGTLFKVLAAGSPELPRPEGF